MGKTVKKVVKIKKKRVVKRSKKIPTGYSFDPRRDGLTQGAIVGFLECREQSRLRLCEGLKRPAWPASVMTWGSIFHDALEAYYGEGYEGEALFSQWREQENYNMLTPEDMEKWELMEEQIRVVADEYFEYWGDQDAAMDWVEVEGEFDIKLEYEKGKFVRIRGKRDAAYELGAKSKKGKPALWLFETKTKGQIAEAAINDTLERDFQLHTYLWALWKETGRMPVGATYNIVRRPGLKLSKKEDIPQYGERVLKHIEDKGRSYYFKRMEYAIVPSALEEFEVELKRNVKDYMEWWDNKQGNGQNPKYGMPCQGKFGLCSMLSKCFWNKDEGLVTKTRPFEELEG